MKKIIYIFVIIMFVLTSCESNNDLKTTNNQNRYSQEQINLVNILRNTAINVCRMTSDKNVSYEIKSIVETSIKYGQDENARFKDLIDSDGSIFYVGTQLHKAPSFNRTFSKVYETTVNDSTGYFLINNNIQVYWPYSENWDGIKVPVITYAPLDKNITEVIAYKLNQDGTIDSLIVNEDFAKNNPVWVINQNNIDYQSLPNFVKGEIKKNNITYLQESKKNLPVQTVEELPLNDSTYVYSLYIGSMKAITQWDSWINGGSEFRFRMVGTNKLSGVIGADYSMGVVSAPAFTRNEIAAGTTKILNSLINIDWGVRETANGFALWEDDGASASQAVKFDIEYDKIKIGAEFKIGGTDDLIYQIALDRSAFFSINKNDNGNGLVDGFAFYTSGGVYWSMPWIITKRVY